MAVGPFAGAEIGRDHGRIALHVARRAFGDLAAAVEHHHVVGDVHHDAHVVLDQHDGDAALLVDVQDVARHVLLLVLVHAAHRLVEQQHLGLQRQRAPQLHALPEAVGERGGRLLAQVLQLQELDDLLAGGAMADLLALRQAPIEHAAEHARAHAHVAAEHQVVEHGEAAEQGDVLERARHAERRDLARRPARDVAALEHDAAGIRLVEAGDHVEQRGLAGAVGADDREDAALGDVDRHAVDGGDAAEVLGNVRNRELNRCRGDLPGGLCDVHQPALAMRAVGQYPRRSRSRPACIDEPSPGPTVDDRTEKSITLAGDLPFQWFDRDLRAARAAPPRPVVRLALRPRSRSTGMPHTCRAQAGQYGQPIV